MLGLLYLAQTLASGAGERAALTALHLGIFLLWQPIWQRDQRLDRVSLLALVAFAIIFVAGASVAILGLWQMGLVGILAARSFASIRERNVHLISLAVVFVLVFFHTVPAVFVYAMPGAVRLIFDVLALGLIFTLLVLPSTGTAMVPPRQYPIDFYRGVALTLLTALAASAAALITETADRPYTEALFAVLIMLTATLLVLSWLLSPQTGFGGIANLWQKSLLNIGSPFEDWMATLSSLMETTEHPHDFLEEAIASLMTLPGISGVQIMGTRTGAGTTDPLPIQQGRMTPHRVDVTRAGAGLTIFCHRAPGPALSKHLQLLLTLLGDFLAAKEQAYQQAAESQLRAIYETGARVAHDIKNLLQSLSTLTHLAETSAGDDSRSERADALLRRQLPEMRRRLGDALRKLENHVTESPEMVDALTWLHATQSAGNEGAFVQIEGHGVPLPAALLQTCYENWRDNLRQKRLVQPALEARVICGDSKGRAVLQLIDDGAPMTARIARDVCRVPVSSEQGFGVGLYQVAKLADRFGYDFVLASNLSGRVVFELRQRSHALGQAAGADHAVNQNGR